MFVENNTFKKEQLERLLRTREEIKLKQEKLMRTLDSLQKENKLIEIEIDNIEKDEVIISKKYQEFLKDYKNKKNLKVITPSKDKYYESVDELLLSLEKHRSYKFKSDSIIQALKLRGYEGY